MSGRPKSRSNFTKWKCRGRCLPYITRDDWRIRVRSLLNYNITTIHFFGARLYWWMDLFLCTHPATGIRCSINRHGGGGSTRLASPLKQQLIHAPKRSDAVQSRLPAVSWDSGWPWPLPLQHVWMREGPALTRCPALHTAARLLSPPVWGRYTVDSYHGTVGYLLCWVFRNVNLFCSRQLASVWWRYTALEVDD